MDRVRKLTGAEPLLTKGFTGKGITAAILDSGIYPHPDLKERIIDFRDFLNGQTGCYDDYGHGTHVAGILAGNGKLSRGRYRGIAPDCRLLPVKVLNRRGNGSRQDILRGIEFVIATREQYHTRILNISVGTLEEGKDDEELIQAVETAWDAGLVVVAAAGNLGPGKESITSPGSSRKIITVGASDDERNRRIFQKEPDPARLFRPRAHLRLYCKAGAYGSRHRDRLLQRPLRFHPPGLHSKKRHLHGHACGFWSRRSASLSASGSFQSRCQNAHVRKRCRSETSRKPSGLGFSPDRPVTSLILFFLSVNVDFRNRHILISDVFFRLRLRFFSRGPLRYEPRGQRDFRFLSCKKFLPSLFSFFQKT